MKKKNLVLKATIALLSLASLSLFGVKTNAMMANGNFYSYKINTALRDHEQNKLRNSIQNQFEQLKKDFSKAKEVAKKFESLCDENNLKLDLDSFHEYLTDLPDQFEDIELASRLNPSKKGEALARINKSISETANDLVNNITKVNEHLKNCANFLGQVANSTFANEFENTYKSEFQNQAEILLATMFGSYNDPFKARVFRGIGQLKTELYLNLRRINVDAVLKLIDAISDLNKTCCTGLQMSNETFLSRFSPIWKDKKEEKIKITPEMPEII